MQPNPNEAEPSVNQKPLGSWSWPVAPVRLGSPLCVSTLELWFVPHRGVGLTPFRALLRNHCQGYLLPW